MKIIGTYKSESSRDASGLNILVWPDSAMIRSGKPVFIPEGEHRLAVALAARIDAVGKTISRRFASRYFAEIAPMVFLLPAETADTITRRRDPRASDIVSDYSVICGNFMPAIKLDDPGSLKFSVSISSLDPENESRICDEIIIENPLTDIYEAIEAASGRNTLKTGDIVGHINDVSFPAREDSVVRIFLNDNILLENKLK